MCWTYNLANDSWLYLTEAKYPHNGYPGNIFGTLVVDSRKVEPCSQEAALMADW